MFTKVMSCTIFVASILATNIVQLITSINVHSSGTHRMQNQGALGALAHTKFINVHRNLVFTIKCVLLVNCAPTTLSEFSCPWWCHFSYEETAYKKALH